MAVERTETALSRAPAAHCPTVGRQEISGLIRTLPS